MSLRKGFILAGGEGTRLYPVTLEIPKPLITVNKKPVLSYLVELYLKYGVQSIKINILEKHVPDFRKWKSECFPDKEINFIIEEEPSGTFAPLMKAGDDWFNETIVVSNGDELKDIDLEEMLEFHKKQDAYATIALFEVDDPRDYGTVKLDGNKITEFLEKSENPPSNYINCGLYMMEPEIRGYFPKGRKFAMNEIDLFPQLASQNKLAGHKWRGKWNDIGTFARWEQAIKTWNR